jgi:hypothetical protein
VNDKILIKLIEKLSIDFFTFTFTYLFAQVLCFVDLQENKISRQRIHFRNLDNCSSSCIVVYQKRNCYRRMLQYLSFNHLISTVQLVAKKKNWNCQKKIDTYLQFFHSVKHPYERYGQNSVT